MYLECASGISGDMVVAALLDLGADAKKLLHALDSLALEGARVHISRVKKSGLDACDFAVELDETHENHDHDMAYLHGTVSETGSANAHSHNSGSAHEYMHVHNHEASHAGTTENGHHLHRSLKEITQIIEKAHLTAGARELALRIFGILADAEAAAHGVPREEVHFHEVGAVDSIIDIVAAAVCLDDLQPARVQCSPLSEGCGTVRCQHGLLPVPVPAVTNIACAHGLRLVPTGIHGELVTPTGAAIAAACMSAFGDESDRSMGEFTIQAVGIGAGKRDYETAGILRAMWLKPANDKHPETEQILKIEATIDDSTGEQLGYCMQRLMEAGARDVCFVPVYMKKNRPAVELHVICAPADKACMVQIIFSETTTIGMRYIQMERTVMERETDTVETVYGPARVKRCRYGTIEKVYPEYESLVQLCQKSGADFRQVYQTVCANAGRTDH